MSDGTKIGWTDASWPVVTGCTHLSEGCDNCYAAKLTGGRLKHLPAYAGLAERGRFNGTVRLLPDRLAEPLHWRKPRKVFVSDMADLFHAGVPDAYIARVFAVSAACPQHSFQYLTKRQGRLRSLLNSAAFTGQVMAELETILETWVVKEPLGPWPLENAWLGVSAENQKWADIRIPSLLDTPAATRFISAEPLLGAIDFRWVAGIDTLQRDWMGSAAGGTGAPHPLLDWVIVGGESGPGHRPMDIGWLEAIVGQCRDAGVPVYVKQDSGPRAGQQGRIPDDLWIHEFPGLTAVPA